MCMNFASDLNNLLSNNVIGYNTYLNGMEALRPLGYGYCRYNGFNNGLMQDTFMLNGQGQVKGKKAKNGILYLWGGILGLGLICALNDAKNAIADKIKSGAKSLNVKTPSNWAKVGKIGAITGGIGALLLVVKKLLGIGNQNNLEQMQDNQDSFDPSLLAKPKSEEGQEAYFTQEDKNVETKSDKEEKNVQQNPEENEQEENEDDYVTYEPSSESRIPDEQKNININYKANAKRINN